MEYKYSERALRFYQKHKKYVDRLIESLKEDTRIQPSEMYDITKPKVWKPCHWNWFINGKIKKKMITREQKEKIEHHHDSGCYVPESLVSENLREDMLIARLQDVIQYVRDGRLTYEVIDKALMNLESKIQ